MARPCEQTLAKLAVDWWITAIKERCESISPEKVNREGDTIIILDLSLAGQISRFESVLCDEIWNCLIRKSYLSLSCSFGRPNRNISQLLTKASMSSSYLPEYSSMEIIESSVFVSKNDSGRRQLQCKTH